MLLPEKVLSESTPREIDGWIVVPLGLWYAEQGPFVVEAVTNVETRLIAVLLCHWRRRYRARDDGDLERAAFHGHVLHEELGGQHEFAWGTANCRLDTMQNRNWIVVQYADGPHVPDVIPAVFGPMYAHASEDDDVWSASMLSI
jgi:hypothetical protein